MPHTSLGIWHVFYHSILTVAQQGRYPVCLSQTSLGFRISYPKAWGYDVVKLEWKPKPFHGSAAAELTGPSSGLQTSHGEKPVVSFCGASLFQLAVVFPLKLWQAINSRENVTKTGCGANGQCLRVSSLKNHKPGTRVSRLLLSWLNIMLFLKILQTCLLLCFCFFVLLVKSCLKDKVC